MSFAPIHATTILGYRGIKDGEEFAIIGGDGQVSFGNAILKNNAKKIRKLYKDQILTGFAGSTADAFSLFDMFEGILEAKRGDLVRSVFEFSNQWRRDKYLRKLEAMMIVLNKQNIFILSGMGDVIEPECGKIAAIGSGGNFALASARALDNFSSLLPRDIVNESLKIAGNICIYTNTNISILEL
ncbi:MAG: ATP-dependent protease subunit HslV [Helicobacter sp.]|nr:ATP-dependent protease subunit HslV [Helicobacter sp.]